MAAEIVGEHRQVPMAEHTTWRCGGAADRVFAPNSIDDLECLPGRAWRRTCP